MKKFWVIFSVLFLLLALASAPALAARPVDNDGDGYKSNQDCNDNDPSINPGATEICDGVDNNCDDVIDEGCGGTCTDNDGDGYGNPADASCTYPDLDCDDVLASVNPGTAEVCDNGIDDDCDGNSDCDDSACGTDPSCQTCNPIPENCTDGEDNDCDGATDCADSDCTSDPACTDPHSGLLYQDYPANCLNCHNTQFNEMADSTHYTWVGDTTEMANQNGTLQGKLTNAVNSYCINILGDWKICGKCHVGRGLRPDDQAAGLENIDCLMCHNEAYALARDRQPDGSMAPAVGLDSYVQQVAKPTTTNCLKCHANAGGGNAVKRGDLSMETASNANADFDVHMNTSASDVQCQQCHVFQNHKTIGRGSDLRPTDDLARGSEVKCVTCHIGMDSGTGHAAAGANRTDADRHVVRVSCQACHIDEYAKVATETHRDWRDTSHHSTAPFHPGNVLESNLPPVLKFWNRTSDNYLLGDTAAIDPATGFYPTSRPMGDINDGKLYPFKYKTADQPMVSGNNVMLALDTLVYIGQTGDVNQAVASGLSNMGYPTNEPVEWITTDTYQLLNHGITQAASIDCAQCHSDFSTDSDNKLDLLGYQLKGPKADVCNQCHSDKKLPRSQDRMHGHLDKGSGIGCGFCHSFERPERGLCSPCDPNCVNEFVDTVLFDHSDVCN